MRTHTTPPLGFLATPPSLPQCSTSARFTGEDLLSQAVEAPVEIVDHTRYRLVPHLANLGKGIAFIKMQPEGLPLFGCQALDQFPPTNPPEQPLARPVVSGHHWCCDVAGFQLVKFHRPIVRARAEVKPSAHRLVVTRLHDPAARRSFRRIVQVRLPKKVQEELLYKVLGFAGVMENSLSDAVDQPGIPAEEKA